MILGLSDKSIKPKKYLLGTTLRENINLLKRWIKVNLRLRPCLQHKRGNLNNNRFSDVGVCECLCEEWGPHTCSQPSSPVLTISALPWPLALWANTVITTSGETIYPKKYIYENCDLPVVWSDLVHLNWFTVIWFDLSDMDPRDGKPWTGSADEEHYRLEKLFC